MLEVASSPALDSAAGVCTRARVGSSSIIVTEVRA
jgi:hypothetical protein